jgi:hypothetical protein
MAFKRSRVRIPSGPPTIPPLLLNHLEHENGRTQTGFEPPGYDSEPGDPATRLVAPSRIADCIALLPDSMATVDRISDVMTPSPS